MNWSHEQKSAVWFKGQIIAGYDGNKWRQDACGAWIAWQSYGDCNSPYGWEIDHVNPNGGDSIGNLQPLQWENNRAKGDGPLVCMVTADGVKNVPTARARARQ